METFPILEFDEDKDAFIRPERVLSRLDVSEHCVLCFFGEAIEKLLEEYPHRVLAHYHAGSIRLPLYELDYNGQRIALMLADVGAPVAASQIEELTAWGCRKFICCGACGVLQKDIAVGHLIVPTVAVRDEGTSYHYAAPSREMNANPRVVAVIEEALAEQGLPYIKAKTWTTDAFYRETAKKIKQRKDEGCVTVEMECSAYIAVADFLGVDFGQILFAGDSLAGDVWDSRRYNDRTSPREKLLRTALQVCLKL